MQDWLDRAAPDVLLLQEVRADPQIASDLLGDDFDTYVAASNLKGRAGVAVAISRDSSVVSAADTPGERVGLALEEADVDTGRWLEVEAVTHAGHPLRLVSAYFHAGQINHPKQEAKMRHLQAVDQRMEKLRSTEEQVLVSGDFNIVRSQWDIKNWKPNHNRTSGVLDEEMAYLNGWVDDGWVDVGRHLAGVQPGPYSWWSWRGKAFDNDAGWRIDYHFASPELGRSAADYQIDRAKSWDTRFSDHAPVVAVFEV